MRKACKCEHPPPQPQLLLLLPRYNQRYFTGSEKESPGKTLQNSSALPKRKATCWKGFGEGITSFVDYGIGPRLFL